MLEKWKIRNFKTVRAETELGLSALTVFAGPNSSGKSTVLQSILLTSQTIGNPVASRSIVLNGRFLRLGSMSDLVAHGAKDKSIALGFEYSFTPPTFWPDTDEFEKLTARRLEAEYQRIKCEYVFSTDAMASNKEQADLQPIIVSCSLSSIDEEDNVAEISVSRHDAPIAARAQELGISFDGLNSDERDSLRFIADCDDLRVLLPQHMYIDDEVVDGLVAGVKFAHFVPSYILVKYDIVGANANQLVQSLFRTTIPRSSDVELPRALTEKIKELANEVMADPQLRLDSHAEVHPTPATTRFATTGRKLLEHFSTSPTARNASTYLRHDPDLMRKMTVHRDELVAAAREQVEPVFALAALPVDMSRTIRTTLFERLRYLGPLRDEPKQFYPLESSADPTDVGLRGEFTAAVLTAHSGTRISYISSRDWAERGPKSEVVSSTLEEAVLDWLRYLEVLNNFDASDRGVYGHELKVSVASQETMQSLVHVGVGVSQVLPILVMALMAKTGSILILEQPELHLHPRVQTRLGDFLLAVSLSGRQCLVETHSEYLINRLRLRVAEDETDVTASMMRMYYVTKGPEGSRYDSVSVNEYGAVPDWPEGFFDQSPKEAEQILRAALKKRNRKAKEKMNG